MRIRGHEVTRDDRPDPWRREAATALPASLAARPGDPRRGLPIPPVNLHPNEDTAEVLVDFTNLSKAVSADLAACRCCSLCDGRWATG
jgi:hypothetical protein